MHRPRILRPAAMSAVAVAAFLMLGVGAGAGTTDGASAITAPADDAVHPFPGYEAGICTSAGRGCQWIGSAQAGLWVELALGTPDVVSLMDGLGIRADTTAPISVVVTDAKNSGVVVRLHVRSLVGTDPAIDPLTSFLSVGFDNSMDKSAPGTGVRLGPLRFPQYAPPLADTIAAVVTTAPTLGTAGWVRTKTTSIPSRGKLPPDAWSVLNQDTTEAIPAFGSTSLVRQPHDIPEPTLELTEGEITELRALLTYFREELRLQAERVVQLTAAYAQHAIAGMPGYSAEAHRLISLQLTGAIQLVGEMQQMIRHTELQLNINADD